MLHVALYEPEIPPNTGNIIRLCANTGVQLHLIEPLGFELTDSRCKRAGLDYREFAMIQRYSDFENFLEMYSDKIIQKWNDSIKKMGQNLSMSIVEIIPILGQVIAEVNSIQLIFSNFLDMFKKVLENSQKILKKG